MNEPISESEFIQFNDGVGRRIQGAVPSEEEVIISVNAQDLVGLMCTPVLLEELTLGFLYNEGLIAGMEDVAEIRVCGSGRCVDVWLHKDIELPKLRIITSGCSGGTTFERLVDARHPIDSDLRVNPSQILTLMGHLHQAAELYRRVRGIHTSALARDSTLTCVTEDVGRHNTIDKLTGLCMRRGVPTSDLILLTSGRVSSEMLAKAAHMGVPLVISRTSPTSLSVKLARAWDITLVGYARERSFRVYTSVQRIKGLSPSEKMELTEV